MARCVVLDSGPLGILVHRSTEGDPPRLRAWAQALERTGVRIVVPEICDYEVRRELLRARLPGASRRLDIAGTGLAYRPLTTATMRLAARLWADARSRGLPTAGREALDGDVILAAQSLVLADEGHDVVVATTNARHLERYVTARVWSDIS